MSNKGSNWAKIRAKAKAEAKAQAKEEAKAKKKKITIIVTAVVAVIVASGCFWFLRGKVPTTTGEEPSKNKMGDLREIFTGLWAILAIIVLVVAARMEVYAAGLLVTLAYMLIHRFPVSRLRALLLQSFQWRLYLNTIGIMVFKEFLSVSGAINGLTASISALPLPSWLVFVLTFFFKVNVIFIILGAIAVGVARIFLAGKEGAR